MEDCFSSFPDSNTFDVGDTVFNFRIRSTTAGRAATGPTTDAGFLYGYVFFRQKQDPSIRRGYFQKSVVLLSQHPFIGLFSKLVSVLGPAYFEVGKPMLETAFHNIASWRPPVTEGMMELPFMGTLYQVQIAKPHQPQLLETAPFDIATFQPDTHILSSVPMNGGLYKHFQDLVPDLWLCWELMTLAEPLMLIGTSPEVCSESVASLVDLINPHFSTLTERFLVPLNRYFATLVPNDISLSSTSQFPHIAPFKQQTFLKYLSKNPPAISFKTSAFKSNSEACQTFYKDFLKCGNFATWLRLRTIAAQNELRRRYLEILSLGDVAGWVKGRNEVELIDLLVRMREELGSFKGELFAKPKSKARPGLSREGSYTSGYTGSDPSLREYGNGSGSDAETRTMTPPPDVNGYGYKIKPSPLTSAPSASPNQLGPKPIPRPQINDGQFSTASSFSSTSSRAATPSRSSSSSSLNAGWAEHREARASNMGSRESSPERQRRRFAPEASIIKATVKQKEQLRDQIRLLIEALPVDLRESLQASESKKKSMALPEGY
ncbi:hypothetical protein BGZ52_010484 [Haplosporangium bisporale]|nr:hypothetical protein BGZ52_010484 [Haplosporangium bisporale]